VDSQAQVLVELLRQVSPLSPEEPYGILRLFVGLEEIRNLGLAEYRIFVTRVLPLLSGSMFRCLGVACLWGGSWAECKAQLLHEYFRYFVRERLISDLNVSYFQNWRQSLRVNIEKVFLAAEFLE